MKGRESLGLVLWLTIVILITSSTNLINISTLETNDSSIYSSSTNSLEIKVHKPGDSFNDVQQLVWSPNDLVQNREMQISVFADGITDVEDIGLLNVKGYYNGEFNDFLSFEIDTTNYDTNFTNNGVILTILFTYDVDTWGGNYTLNVNLNLDDGTNISGSFDKLLFSEYDYNIYTDELTEMIYVCECDSTRVSLTVLNSGPSDTYLNVDFRFNGEDAKGVTVTLDQNNNDEVFEETQSLAGGETSIINLILTPNDDFDENARLMIRPIYAEIYYETDEGDLIYLYQDDYSMALTPLPENVNPYVSVTSNQFDYSANFYGNQQNIDEIDTIFTLGSDWFYSNYEIDNPGFYASALSLDSNSNVNDFKIIHDNQNLTLVQFNELNYQIEQNGQFDFDIYINFDSSVADFIFELDIVLDKDQITAVSIKLSSSPLENKQIISMSNNELVFEEGEDVETVEVLIETSSLSGLNYFENNWSLFCSELDNIIITIVDLSISCNDDGIPLPTDIDQIYNLEITVMSWGIDNIESLQIGLLHNPTGISSSISQVLTISLELEDTSDNGDQNNNGTQNNDTQNNTNNSNNSNNSGDNNSDNNSDNTDPIDDNNQTNLEIDVDNDGVMDTSDNCLDTKPGETVDEFGCTIIDQNGDDEVQDDGNIQQQENEATSSKSEENNTLLYVVLGLVIAAIVGGILVIRSRKSSPQNNAMQSKSINPIMPLPAIPMPTLEPVVLQQWTDSNGYSWRQMSDQSIMWWNGSEWIPYGKN